MIKDAEEAKETRSTISRASGIVVPVELTVNYKSSIHFFRLTRNLFKTLVRCTSRDTTRGCYLLWRGRTGIPGR